MNLPEDCLYTKSHEWVRKESDGVVSCGITDHAQDVLNDIVFVELPEVGEDVEAGAELGVVESVKAASEVYAPVSGTVTAVNEKLDDAPELINQSPYGDGWFIEIELSEPSQLEDLMGPDAYREFLEEEA